eukprot:TRINITY_DN23010_c0_g1_i1.p1 TRINITY_DN23010_c0_g1~~TRINITY_DN23010_c0_g1_i1.p1  ORF type:complete len:630 (+),score=65.45 TRINITY_DN23010_c0_g1_i1:48-1937(+)
MDYDVDGDSIPADDIALEAIRSELMARKMETFDPVLSEPLLVGIHDGDTDEDEEQFDDFFEFESEGSEIPTTRYTEAAGARRANSKLPGSGLSKVLYSVVVQGSLLFLLVCFIVLLLVLLVFGYDRNDDEALHVRYCTLIMTIIFTIESYFRFYCAGIRLTLCSHTTKYYHKAGRVISVLVLTTASTFEVLYLEDGWLLPQSLLRLAVVITVLVGKISIAARIGEKTVSSARRRYIAGGYDLDLTYITERMIAMSWPSLSIEALYRNKIDDVVKFLDAKHPGTYKVYNLCAEREYDKGWFHGRVERIKIDDHQPCDLSIIAEFCKSAEEYLAADPRNVIIVHCKGGKGRTGMMCCSHLVWSGEELSVATARKRFGKMRTEVGAIKVQTVESPSQNLYLKYFESCLKLKKPSHLGPPSLSPGQSKYEFVMPETKSLKILTIEMGPLPECLATTPHKYMSALLQGSDGDVLWTSVQTSVRRRQSVFDRIGRKSDASSGSGKYTIIIRHPYREETFSPEEYQQFLATHKITAANAPPNAFIRYDVSDCSPIAGNIRFHFVQNGLPWAESTIWTWFHTSFVDPVVGILLTRPDVDGAHKDNEHKKYSPKFSLRLTFDRRTPISETMLDSCDAY